MALRDRPYLPLYVQDFLTDEKLSECSAESTGVYIRLMCLMHKSEHYGVILLKQKDKQTGKQISDFAIKLARQMPYDVPTIERSLTELLEEKVISLDDDALHQKRMVKDGKLSDIRASAGSKRTSKKLKQDFAGDFASGFATAKHEANTEYEYENEYEDESNGDIGEAKTNSRTRSASRRKYGEYGWVQLTDSEYQRLVHDLGEPELRRCIEYIDESAQTTTNKNKWRDWNLVVRKCSKQQWGVDPRTRIAPPSQNAMGDLQELHRIFSEEG